MSGPWATYSGQTPTVPVLFDEGSDPDSEDPRGHRVVTGSEECGHPSDPGGRVDGWKGR